MSFTAVIRISKFVEVPTLALDSILDNKHKFKQVIIVTKTKQTIKSKYDSLDITQCPSLKIKDYCVIEMSPYSTFTESTIETIEKAIKHSKFEHTVFHIPTTTTLTPTYYSWCFYGIFLVSYVIQWFREMLSMGTMFKTDDILVRMVITKGNKKVVSPPNNYNVAKYTSDDCAHITLTNVDTEYIYRHLNQHRHYGFGWWILPMLWVWICIVFTILLIASGQIHKNVILFGSISTVLLYSFTIELISYYYLRISGKKIFILLFPIYYLFFPFVILYCRLKIKRN